MIKSVVITSFILIALHNPAMARGRSSGSGGCCVLVHSYLKSNGTFVHSYLRSLPSQGGTTKNPAGTSTGTGVTYGSESKQQNLPMNAAGSNTPDQDEAALEEYKPIFKANDLCKGHKLLGTSTGAGYCVFGGRDEAE